MATRRSRSKSASTGECYKHFCKRASAERLVVIVDSRHPLTPLDQLLVGTPPRGPGAPVLVLLTKADKLARQHAMAALKESQAVLASRFPNATAQLFSAVDGTGLRPRRRR